MSWIEDQNQWGTFRWYVSDADGAWVSYLEESNWTIQGSDGSWNGSGWDNNGLSGLLSLIPAGGWETDFRPTKMRVTYTGITSIMDLRDTSAGSIVKDLTYTSGEEKDTTWYGNNIGILLMEAGAFNSITVTELEFSGG